MNTKFVKHMTVQEKQRIENALNSDMCVNVDVQDSVIRFVTPQGIKCDLFSTDITDPVDGIGMYIPMDMLLALYDKDKIYKPRHSTSINKRLNEGNDEEDIIDSLWRNHKKSAIEGTYSLRPDPAQKWYFTTDASVMYHRVIKDKHHIIFDSGADGSNESQVYEVKPNEILKFGAKSPAEIFENTQLIHVLNEIAANSGDF